MFIFMTAWVLETRLCPTLLNEIDKAKLKTYTEPQAGINILLPLFCRSQIHLRLNDVKVVLLV